ncbi:MAG: DEAD/DEAH box helicase [Bacteroidetes bacterium]|nr:DEAD/DEAH box helicase [Bacteroidota bacterium]
MNHSEILSRFNIDALNKMQVDVGKAIIDNNSVVLISPTGSGKTLAFLLPLLRLINSQANNTQALILVPSRELAIQIEQVFKQMKSGLSITCCYGGHSTQIEKNNLDANPHIVVGTPGRIAHHIKRGTISSLTIHTLILDEFDKSLQEGFHQEMSFIINYLRNITKRILTSATELKLIPDFVGIENPTVLDFTTPSQDTKPTLKMKFTRAKGVDKFNALFLLLGSIGNQSKIVFCNHRDTVERISEQLTKLTIEHGIYHGGLEQIDREKTLIKLRNGSIQLIVTTDLASRGLDIPELEAIVHYQLPTTQDVMIHRNGRTARMNASGTAYFLLDEGDYLPPFLDTKPEEIDLPKKLIIPEPCNWKTLYIAAGKKDKINKMDIVGMLLKKGGLQKEELGKIEVLDHSAYAAIKSDKIVNTLDMVRNEKIKNRKIKMEISS